MSCEQDSKVFVRQKILSTSFRPRDNEQVSAATRGLVETADRGVRRSDPDRSTSKPENRLLLLAALGVVYGDIGTSPIYTFRECLKAGGAASSEAVLGLLSLVFWSLTIVVTTKYVLFVMRADYHGEGGIMALLGLAAHSEPDLKRRSALILLGIACFMGMG
jgi:K+ transporter